MLPASADRRFAAGQFTLRSLFELTTLCGMLAALVPAVGVGGAVSLMFFALCLHLRLGGLSLIALAGAFFTSPLSAGADSYTPLTRQIAVALAATAVCGWYWYRSRAAAVLT